MARKAKLTGAAVQVLVHLYRGDRIWDHRGEDRCGDCGLARGHRVHQIDAVDPEVAETTHRMTGERRA